MALTLSRTESGLIMSGYCLVPQRFASFKDLESIPIHWKLNIEDKEIEGNINVMHDWFGCKDTRTKPVQIPLIFVGGNTFTLTLNKFVQVSLNDCDFVLEMAKCY